MKHTTSLLEFYTLVTARNRRLLQLAICVFSIVIMLSAVHSLYARVSITVLQQKQVGQISDQKTLSASRSVVLGSVATVDGVNRVKATVTLTNIADGKEISTSTDRYNFIFQSVRPGNYKMTITALGYTKNTIDKIEVLAGYEAAVDLTLMKDGPNPVISGPGEVLNGGLPVVRQSRDDNASRSGDSAIHGVVLDPMGAVVGRAELVLTNANNHKRQTTLTDNNGMFGFRNIGQGTYDLTVAYAGFYQFKVEDINLGKNEGKRVIAVLQVDSRIGGMEVWGGPEVLTVNPAATKLPEPIKPAVETGITPLMTAVAANDLVAIKNILAEGADVDSTTNYGLTALMKITDKTSPDAIRELLIAGADVNHNDKEERTALLIAARVGQAAVVQTLLDVGAHGNVFDSDGNTALINAVLGKRIENVKVLIAAKIDLSRKNKHGLSALQYAINNKSQGIVKLLKASGATE